MCYAVLRVYLKSSCHHRHRNIGVLPLAKFLRKAKPQTPCLSGFMVCLGIADFKETVVARANQADEKHICAKLKI